MQDHIGSSKIHSKLNNKMNSKSQVQPGCFMVYIVLLFSWKFYSIFQEKANTHTYIHISKLQN